MASIDEHIYNVEVGSGILTNHAREMELSFVFNKPWDNAQSIYRLITNDVRRFVLFVARSQGKGVPDLEHVRWQGIDVIADSVVLPYTPWLHVVGYLELTVPQPHQSVVFYTVNDPPKGTHFVPYATIIRSPTIMEEVRAPDSTAIASQEGYRPPVFSQCYILPTLGEEEILERFRRKRYIEVPFAVRVFGTESD